jgi:acyl-CoA dehydrogenase
MSDDLHEEIRATVSAICVDALDTSVVATDFDAPLWSRLADNGFTLLGLDERLGGSGGDVGDAAVALSTTARYLVAVPFAESTFIAAWLLGEAGLVVPGLGPMTVTTDVLRVRRGAGPPTVSGRARAPWGRFAENLVALVEDNGQLRVAVFPLTSEASEAGQVRVEQFENLAGEARDLVAFDLAPLPDLVAPGPAAVDSLALEERGALARSLQLAGAAEAVLAMALRHAAEREQFGRALHRFQSVQQQLAILAGEVTAMGIACQAAVLAVETGTPGAGFAIAAAKASTSARAQLVTSIGHQLHGAMGYSSEHRLGSATTRLWSWRDEFGNESMWQDRLADLALRHDSWWQAVTS